MSESTERWLPVVGYEGLYEVSDHGRVRSLPRRDSLGRPVAERILKTPANSRGYHHVDLSRNGQRTLCKVHQLVLAAFVGPRPEGLIIRHRNDVPGDNRLSNLLYGTHSENSQDIVRNGNHYEKNKTHCPQGHKYTPENTYVAPRGDRQCRTCMGKREAERVR